MQLGTSPSKPDCLSVACSPCSQIFSLQGQQIFLHTVAVGSLHRVSLDWLEVGTGEPF